MWYPVIWWFIRKICIYIQVTNIILMNIWSPSMVSKMWTFLRIGSDKGIFCYVKEVTLESTQKWGLVKIGANHVIRVLGFPILPSNLQGEESGSRLNQWPVNNDLMNHAQVMKLHKNSLENFQVGGAERGECLERAWKLDAHLARHISSSGCSWAISFYHKPVI